MTGNAAVTARAAADKAAARAVAQANAERRARRAATAAEPRAVIVCDDYRTTPMAKSAAARMVAAGFPHCSCTTHTVVTV